MGNQRDLGPNELSYIIRAKIEGKPTLTYAFQGYAALQKLKEDAEWNARLLNHGMRQRMQLHMSEVSELIR